jgi:ABC-type cobalamin/Fe3+-siderophores transport system ATPase subunit
MVGGVMTMSQVEKSIEVKIKNIGKLEDAEVSIGQFTIFAGPNNTGKSFASKLLYSLFNAMNANHVETYLNNLFRPVYDYIMMSMRLYKEELSDKAMFSWQSSMQKGAEKLEALVKKASIKEFGSEGIVLEDIIPDLISQMEQMEQIAAEIPQGSTKKRAERRQRYLDRLTNSLIEVKKELHQTKAKNFIVAGIGHELSQNLIQNFQVPNVSDLIRVEGTPSEVVVEDFGKFAFLDEGVGFEIDRSWIKQLQQYSRVIYLESPVYWKLKTALEYTRDYSVHFGDRERLSGVPGYFYDLARALRFEYTGDLAFPDVYAKLTGKNVMGGKIAISETGNLSFHENGKNFSLPVTAMGIANLGILALLIDRKVLDKGTFLFIDEPEAHLHPAWQVVMAESLFELSRQGVNVVIATHSADILQWLDVHVKKNPDDEQLIALNQFPVKKDKAEEDFETKMGKIMHELTKPFSDLYIEGI